MAVRRARVQGPMVVVGLSRHKTLQHRKLLLQTPSPCLAPQVLLTSEPSKKAKAKSAPKLVLGLGGLSLGSFYFKIGTLSFDRMDVKGLAPRNPG